MVSEFYTVFFNVILQNYLFLADNAQMFMFLNNNDSGIPISNRLPCLVMYESGLAEFSAWTSQITAGVLLDQSDYR